MKHPCAMTPAPFGDVTYRDLWGWLHPPGLEPEGRGPGSQVELGQCTQAAKEGVFGGFLSLTVQEPRLSANFSTDQLQGQARDVTFCGSVSSIASWR